MAAIDFNKNILLLKSGKELQLANIIIHIMERCSPLIVATDKAKIPELVANFAAKTGSRIIRPHADLKVEDKRVLVENEENKGKNQNIGEHAKNSHELDALASALFAHKQLESLIRKINLFTKKYKKENIKDSIFRLVVKEGLSIKSAVQLIIEQPESEDAKLIKKVIAQTHDKQFSKADLVNVYNKLSQEKADNALLRKNVNDLNSAIGRLKKEIELIREQANTRAAEKFEASLKIRMQKTESLHHEIEKLKALNEKVQEKIQKLNRQMLLIGSGSGSGDYIMLKKLRDLSWQEFSEKNKTLNIAKEDILFIDEPGNLSTKTLEELREKVRFAVCKNHASKKAEERTGLIFIGAEKVQPIQEEELFCIISRTKFAAEASKADILNKVVEEYRRKRAA